MSAEPQIIRPVGVIGSDKVRVDGWAKVTGKAVYAADQPVDRLAHAALVLATIARGRIRKIDCSKARNTLGVLEILTHENVGHSVKGGRHVLSFGYMATSFAPLSSDRIVFAGQIVAVVIAETEEIARAAAQTVQVEYRAKRPTASFDDPGLKVSAPKSMGEPELSVGSFSRGFRRAAAKVDAWYETPPQHHNPMELFQTTCAWNEAGHLTVWESSQNVRGYRFGLAQQLGISHKKIRFISSYVGGAFGSKGEISQVTALIALAAKRIDRPVKFVATRREGFTLRTFRAETRHHLRVGADRQGRLTALSHDSWELTSRTDRFALCGSDSTSRLYACPNVRTLVKNVQADRQTPGFMRAPPETPYLFALECAMDELAYALKLDPLDLRRRNDTMVETVTQKPYTSRSLQRCIDTGALAFGWSARDPRPASMRDGDALVGFGYSSAFYPVMMGPADCRVTLTPELKAIVEIGTHEIGTGVRTVLAQTASDRLGLAISSVEVRIGDSDLPAAPLSAGSSTTATVCTVVAQACEKLRSRIASTSLRHKESLLRNLPYERIEFKNEGLWAGRLSEPLRVAVQRAGRGKPLVAETSNNPHGAPSLVGPALIRRGKTLITGGAMLKDRMQFSFGAQFVEVRIDRYTGQIRVPRILGAFAAGRIMNPRTARSQLSGGQIWGIGAALLEATEIDHRLARYVNPDLAEYHLPVSADVGEVTTLMLDEEDHLVNPLGIKGVGELGLTGMNAAIANAVFHATGIRCRKLPIRVDSLLPFLAKAFK